MTHQTGVSRHQVSLFSLDSFISADNPVRVIDLFVEKLDLAKLGFLHVQTKSTGRPPIHPKVLLKIYLYGYFNRVRSSRRLEAECGRNIELMWLTDNLIPNYHTIADFRSIKPHRKGFREVFRIFNRILRGADLFGGETVAVDGTKIKAVNSKKNNISAEKINKKIEYHEQRFEEYVAELDRADAQEAEGIVPTISPDALLAAMEETHERIGKLEEIRDAFKQAQKLDPTLTQISLTDPDARAMPINNMGMVDICYNVQSTVDDKHYLIADFMVDNRSDYQLLAEMGDRAKTELEVETLTVLADKGYHDSEELHKCAENNIVTYVAYPDQSYKDRPKGFTKADFLFDETTNTYICPAGNDLTTTGKIYEKKGRNNAVQSRFTRYQLPAGTCANCPFADKCLSENDRQTRHGRHLDRNIFEQARTENRERVLNGRAIYKRRQAIVEHPFGTIKRHWGYYYTLLKGKEKVSAEYSLVFFTYNLRRALNILGTKDLINRLNNLFSLFLTALARSARTQIFCAGILCPKSGCRRRGAGRFERAVGEGF